VDEAPFRDAPDATARRLADEAEAERRRREGGPEAMIHRPLRSAKIRRETWWLILLVAIIAGLTKASLHIWSH